MRNKLTLFIGGSSTSSRPVKSRWKIKDAPGTKKNTHTSQYSTRGGVGQRKTHKSFTLKLRAAATYNQRNSTIIA